ncbi:MAG: membrane protein insertase YidC [Bacteroidetes bacterium]|nr:MAG: membrane protein insertase YidC [Bacteroidota bacterium]
MGFDRNTITGFVLLGLLFVGYFYYVKTGQNALNAEKKRFADSVALTKPKVDTARLKADSMRLTQLRDSVSAGDFEQAAKGTEEVTMVENNLAKYSFSNKGGWLQKIELKKYKGPDSQLVRMNDDVAASFGYAINTTAGQSTETHKLFFNPAVVAKTPAGEQTISYQVVGPNGKIITHAFVIKPDDYMVDATIDLAGADQLLSKQSLNLRWQTIANRQQADVEYEKSQSRLVYNTDNEFDYNSAVQPINETLDKPTQWVGFKQQFFNSTLLYAKGFSTVQAEVAPAVDTVKTHVAALMVNARVQVPAGNRVSIPLQLFYGPNDYYVLKKYNNNMQSIVDLGSGMFAFVKYLNMWLILPVFEFLTRMIGSASMGWAILLLTIIIRLLIAPLTYSSYLSGAKMKALRPELDAMKARVGNDQQAQSMEQMKLFREAGVNPLGGCIPALFQIPIFFALFSFFNSNIDLRGESFLWATDLSSYDSIFNFGFTIPWYGNHISLFTITACLTSFAISMYTMSSTPDTGNPVMKYMPYIFPFMMLFFFNKLPSALTWYYTVSNAITLALQFVIQNYIIDHDKVLAQIKANKLKPKTKSKWQEKLESMQATQQTVAQTKKKQ